MSQSTSLDREQTSAPYGEPNKAVTAEQQSDLQCGAGSMSSAQASSSGDAPDEQKVSEQKERAEVCLLMFP